MIIQNGQNRNLAICNARQVAMLRGGQWIIEPAVLSPAVKSHIYEDIVTTGHHSASLAAEVWRAANLYCKSHAASHPELTAQGKLLSSFVNADKDMYCSLPLTLTAEAQSALPTRWLIGNANGHFDTLYIPNQDTCIETTYKLQSGGCKVMYGVCEGTASASEANGMLKIYNSPNRYGFGMGSGTTIDFSEGSELNRIYTLKQEKNKLYLDGVLKLTMPTPRVTWTNTKPLWLYARNGGSSFDSDDMKTRFKIWDNVEQHNFIPNKQNNLMELLDLETLTLATRVGTFTEQKDIPIS